MDLLIIGGMAILGIADVWVERLTGEGIIGHIQDWMEARRD